MSEIRKIVSAVNDFSGEMVNKMLSKYAEGYRGWDSPYDADLILEKLKKNLRLGKYINVANLAMMLHRFSANKKDPMAKYIQHLPQCGIMQPQTGDTRCTCGLRALKEQKEKPE